MGWWDRAEEELPADNGLGPLCWGSMAVSMLVSAIMGVATVWGVLSLLVGW
jgi:hypothetical protein